MPFAVNECAYLVIRDAILIIIIIRITLDSIACMDIYIFGDTPFGLHLSHQQKWEQCDVRMCKNGVVTIHSGMSHMQIDYIVDCRLFMHSFILTAFIVVYRTFIRIIIIYVA